MLDCVAGQVEQAAALRLAVPFPATAWSPCIRRLLRQRLLRGDLLRMAGALRCAPGRFWRMVRPLIARVGPMALRWRRRGPHCFCPADGEAARRLGRAI